MGMTPEKRRKQLQQLFNAQFGRCDICGDPAVLDGEGGNKNSELSAVRFRRGSSFGTPGRVRPRVMAHRKCADKQSARIVDSQPIEELWHRSKRSGNVYELKHSS